MKTKRSTFLKKIFNSRLFFLSIFITLILITVSFSKEFIKNYKINQEIESLQREIESLETKNFELSELIKYFATDDFIEERARIDLGLKKPGETMVIIAEPEDTFSDSEQKQITEKEQTKPEKISNPKKWWNYFINKQGEHSGSCRD